MRAACTAPGCPRTASGARAARRLPGGTRHDGERSLAAQVAQRVEQRTRRHDLDAPNRRRLRRVLPRHQRALEPLAATGLDRGEHAAHGADRRVETELADEQPLRQGHRGIQGPLRGEDAQRDRQVERGALLARGGGREVGGHGTARPRPAAVGDGAVDALAPLAQGPVGQPHDPEDAATLVVVDHHGDLDVDQSGVRAEDRRPVGAGKGPHLPRPRETAPRSQDRRIPRPVAGQTLRSSRRSTAVRSAGGSSRSRTGPHTRPNPAG